MDDIINIDVEELDVQFIENLQEKYRGAKLEIRVSHKTYPEKDENWFWKVISMLAWSEGNSNDAIIEPVIHFLSNQSDERIFLFQDILSEKLYQLDGQDFAEQIGTYAYGLNGHFSGDLFLYTRCAVVANGREVFQKVKNDPSKMLKDLTFEPLLYVAEQAYLKKTGKELNRLPAYNYESFFNSNGWGEKAIQF